MSAVFRLTVLHTSKRLLRTLKFQHTGGSKGQVTSSWLSGFMAIVRLSKRFRVMLLLIIFTLVMLYVMSRSDMEPMGWHTLLSSRGEENRLFLQLQNSYLLNDTVVLRASGHAQKGNGVKNPRVNLQIPIGSEQWGQLRTVMKEAEERLFPWKPIKVLEVDCSRLLAGDKKELQRAQQVKSDLLVPQLSSANITSAALGDCNAFQEEFGFITSSLSEEERDFPIAFTILVFKEAAQVLDLLRAIYRPQNYYCIHVDVKSDTEFKAAMKAIADCFLNVFLASRSVDVSWGTITVLEPEVICMNDLWQYKKWKYLINLTGQEFPLRTNYELVKILKAYNGANNLEGTRKRANGNRWSLAGQPPGGLNLTKGSVHVTVNRDFVDFVLHTKLGQEFFNWSRRVDIPDESYFSTLNHNPKLGIRGTYKGIPETDPVRYPFLTRFKNWGDYPFGYPCAGGMRVRLICVLSTGDLPLLDKRPELFANKFYANYSQLALGCLGERLFNHTRDQFLGIKQFNVSYYENLSFVKNKVERSTFNRTW